MVYGEGLFGLLFGRLALYQRPWVHVVPVLKSL